MNKISRVRDHIESTLFPFIEEELGPLTEKQQKLVSILEMDRIEDFVPVRWWHRGRLSQDRVSLAKIFLTKMVYNCSTTRELLDRLATTRSAKRSRWNPRKKGAMTSVRRRRLLVFEGGFRWP